MKMGDGTDGGRVRMGDGTDGGRMRWEKGGVRKDSKE